MTRALKTLLVAAALTALSCAFSGHKKSEISYNISIRGDKTNAQNENDSDENGEETQTNPKEEYVMPSRKLLENVKMRKLENGLTVALLEKKSSPVTAMQLWIKAGSAMETDEEAGIAHLIEHMVFKGSSKFPNGEYSKYIESLGGDVNAWTSFEQTVFHVTMSSTFAAQGLEALADLVLNPKFDSDDLELEKKVVIEEIKRGKDNPASVAEEALFELSFPKHNYGRPVIGFEKTVSSFKSSDLFAWHKKFYSPGNAILVIVGDLDEKETDKRVDEIFKNWKKTGGKKPVAPKQPVFEKEGPFLKILKENVKEPRLLLGFPIKGLIDPSMAPLDIIGVALAEGESSRFAVSLDRRKGLVSDYGAGPFAGKSCGLFIIELTMINGQEAEAITEALSIISGVAENGAGEHEIFAAKKIVESETIFHYETAQGVAGRIGYSIANSGDPLFELRHLTRVLASNADTVKSAAKAALDFSKMSAVLLVPADGGGKMNAKWLSSQLKAGLESKKTAAKLKKLEYGIVSAELKNGIKLLVRELHDQPVVSVRAAALAGSYVESKDNNGVSELLSSLLTMGTENMSGEEIAKKLDSMGATMDGFSGRNTIGLKANFLSSTLMEGLDLFLDCLFRYNVPEKDFMREKKLQMESIKAKEDNPASIAFDLMRSALYGDHPYSLPPEGTLESVAHLKRSDVLEFGQRYLSPHKIVISIVGDVDAAHVAELINHLAGGIPPYNTRDGEIAKVTPLEKNKTVVKELNKQQSHLVVGCLGPKFTSKDRAAIQVLNAALGGAMGGRLFETLRDKMGLAYSVGSYIVEGIDEGYIALYIGTSPETSDKALAGLLAEMENAVKNPPDEEELDRARKYLKGTTEVGLQSSGAQAMSMLLSYLYEGDAAAPFKLGDAYMKVTAKDAAEAAKKYFASNCVTAKVEPAK